MTDRLVLRTALGKHDHVKPLKDGRIKSDRVQLEFIEFDPLPKAFRYMVRGGELDVSEMALTTHLLADHYRKPLTALPIPLWRRLHHANLVCTADSGIAGPADLQGKKVGVRAYSQTTGVWIRGILASQYDVDLDKVTWVTMEDAHVAEYQDPPNAARNMSDKSLRELLFSNELVAIMGERDVDPANVRTVIPNAEAEAERWSKRTGIFPVNHVVSVRNELLEQYPWLANELMAMFEAARRESGARGAAALPYGLEPNLGAMQMLLDFAAAQRLTPRTYRVDELFVKAS
ncbi:MAG: ABC transporter substrate-binding protein [Dongiaceae bacterium]